MQEKDASFDGRLLLITTLLISICSIIYELIISSISSYLKGDSITQFSITIGLYMSAMGIGSYISKYVRANLFDKFIFVEITLGILGGFSSFILFFAYIYTQIYELIMYSVIILIGILVGIEIPLLTRIIEENNSNIRVNLANIFTFDYIGGLIGSLSFPLLLFPKLGFVTTSFLVGSINILGAILIIFKYKKYIKSYNIIKYLCIFTFSLTVIFMLSGKIITKNIESGLYRDDIILSKQTLYQKIIMTKHKDDLRLFLNGNIQFSSRDEYRYHEALVHVPFLYAKEHKRVLILGGGDGLAAREVLKYEGVEEIVLVDIDSEMTNLCKSDKQISALSNNSLSNNKVKILNEDAYLFVSENQSKFDVIIIDFPDPNNESLNKLYTNVFYNHVKANLNENGVMAAQSTSPYYARNSFWCIHKTIATQFKHVLPYHAHVPSFGEWGFNLAYNGDLERKSLTVETSFLNHENIGNLFNFAQDEKTAIDNIEVNDMFKPVLINYYNKDVENW